MIQHSRMNLFGGVCNKNIQYVRYVSFDLRITWCQKWDEIHPPVPTSDHLSASTTFLSKRRQTTAFGYFGSTIVSGGDSLWLNEPHAFQPRHYITNHTMPKHDKPILDINAVRANRDHFRHWETRFHDSCLLEGYRNPAKDRLTQTADHYIEAKRPFELAVLRRVIPSSEWNTLDDVITSKIPPDDADKPWIWLQKIKDHYVGASTLM